MAVPTLTDRDVRKTLRERSKTKTSAQAKAYLINPYSYTWPVVDKVVSKEVIEKISSLLQTLPLASPKITWKEKQKRKEQLKNGHITEESEDEKKRKCLRSQLAIGVNAITRGLEKDELSLFIVCQSAEPPLITKHLIPLAASRLCPALCLPRFSEKIAPYFGFKSLIGVGFKKCCSKEDSEFNELVSFCQNKAVPIVMPWDDDTEDVVVLSPKNTADEVTDSTQELTEENKKQSERENSDSGVKDGEEQMESSSKDETENLSTAAVKFVPKDDYSYLYVFKSEKKKLSDLGEFISIRGYSDDDSDSEHLTYKQILLQRESLQETDVAPETKKLKRHLTASGDVLENLSGFSNFKYKKTRIGHQIKNPDKKQKKKLLKKSGK